MEHKQKFKIVFTYIYKNKTSSREDLIENLIYIVANPIEKLDYILNELVILGFVKKTVMLNSNIIFDITERGKTYYKIFH